MAEFMPLIAAVVGVILTALLGATTHLFMRVMRLEISNAKLETLFTAEDLRELRRSLGEVEKDMRLLMGHLHLSPQSARFDSA